MVEADDCFHSAAWVGHFWLLFEENDDMRKCEKVSLAFCMDEW